MNIAPVHSLQVYLVLCDIFILFIFITLKLCMCVPVSGYMHVSVGAHRSQEYQNRTPQAGVSGCEFPNMGARTQTLIFYKSSKCS